MKKVAIVTIALLAMLTFACTRASHTLAFRPDGTFKILQLTDLHLQLFRPDQVADVFARMDSLVSWENPDLITVTGDLVYSTPADSIMQPIIDRLDSYERPWVIVYGNHDHEHGLTLPELSRLVIRGKHTLNTLAPSGVLADMEMPVTSSRTRSGISAYLYFLDSHAYADTSFFSYAWFDPEQVEWVRKTAGKHPGTPSIAFFHIPLCEYADTTNHYGTFGEPVCCGKKNTGMFDAMKETGVIATFCGHDHDNDYVVEHEGVLLAYGRYSGSNGEYNHLPKGARIILLHYDGALDTWIRESDGSIVQNYSYLAGKTAR